VQTATQDACHLGTDSGVKESAEVWPEVASNGVAKQVVLGLPASTGVDVRLDAHAAPLHQHVWHVAEQLRLYAAALEALLPDVTLHRDLPTSTPCCRV